MKRFGNNLCMEPRHFAGGLRDSLYLSINEGATWSNITGNLNAADLNGSGIFEHNGCNFIGYNLISPGQGIYRADVAPPAWTMWWSGRSAFTPIPVKDRSLWNSRMQPMADLAACWGSAVQR